MHNASRLLAATAMLLAANSVPRISEAAILELPPAEFQPLPVGTILRYDKFTCRIEKNFAFQTNCEDQSADQIRLFGKFELVGDLLKNQHYSSISPLVRQDGSKSRVLRNVKLSDIARNAIKELWPLSVGRTAKYTIQIVDNTSRQRRWDVDSVVSETENITVSGKVYPVYIINQTARLHSRKYPGDYRKTSWYDPVQGVIVRERIERTNGYSKGKISEISLVNVTFPQDAPHITRVVPQAPAAQPLQVQRPPPQPKVAALPPPKPPVQKAVEVALDKSGPAIEIPASIETDQSVVEIAGRILDNSRIIEVHLDGRPVPMAADGSISVRRGVPAGMTTFTILLIRDTPPVGMYVLNMFRMRGSRLWGSRLHRACVV